MARYVLKGGLNLPIAGAASGAPVALPVPATVGFTPQEFRGIIPKPLLKDGDVVKRGTPVMAHKRDMDLKFLSPVSGVVKEVRRGDKRVVTDVIIESRGDEAESYPVYDLGRLAKIGADEARAAVRASGGWAYLRTRPLNKIADASVTPQAILVSAYETGPLQPGADVLLDASDKDAIQAGIYALKALTSGAVYLVTGDAHPALQGLQGVEEHSFGGAHPAGDPAVQVNHVAPPRGQGQVWWIRAWELALIGRFLLTGQFPGERIYAAVGVGAKSPRFVKTVAGAPLSHIVGEAQADCRWIRGSVLTGDKSSPEQFASFYARAVHVLPEAVERELLGWITPQLGRFSFHRAFLSAFGIGAKSYDIRPGLFGGERAMIPFAHYEKVIQTPDIMPEFLFRSIIAGDLDDSIRLGLLDITEEEAALMTYICPSKIEYDVLLRDALVQYEKEF